MSMRARRGWGDTEPDRQTSSPKLLRAIIFIGTVCGVAALSIIFLFSPAQSTQSPDRPAIAPIRQVVSLPEFSLRNSISYDGVRVEEVYLEIPGCKIFLEKYPVAFEPIAGAVSPQEGEFAQEYFQENSKWYAGYEQKMVQTSFNCGTFAVGDFIGLESVHVLDGVQRPGFGNPMQTVLDTFFAQIHSFSTLSNLNQSDFENDSRLKENDVISFVETRSPDLMFVHSGRIIKRNDQNYILSKVGRRGPILMTNLRLLLRVYPCSEIRIHRIRGGST